MNFREIEREIERKCERAMEEIAEWGSEQAVYAVDKFYSGYSPEFYERTYQLYNTVGRYPSVHKKGNGCETYIYMFSDELDYSQKKFSRWRGSDGVYHNPFNWRHTSNDVWFDNKGYNEWTTWSTALFGDSPHGGHGSSDTSIFRNLHRKLREDYEWRVGFELTRAGLPVSRG